MPLPLSTSLSLSETVRFVVERTGEAIDRVCASLTEAALMGAISATGCLHLSVHRDLARYFSHPVRANRQIVPSSAWGGPISWRESRVGRYDLVRFERADIERWLASAETAQRSDPASAAQQASERQTVPSGIRTNRAANAEEACGKWISRLKERPKNKRIAFTRAAAAVANVGTLSWKAFERQWAINARPEWRRAGRRRRS